MLQARPRPGRLGPLDRVLVALVPVLGVASVAMLVLPVPRAGVAAGLDVCLDTVTTLVALSVAVLSWSRYRQREQPVALFQAAAFGVLAIADAAALLLVVAALGSPHQRQPLGEAPLYIANVARLSAAALLGLGAASALTGHHPRRPGLVVLLPIATILALIAVLVRFAGALPLLTLTEPVVMLPLPGIAQPSFPTPNGLGALLQVWTAALFLWAAFGTRRVYLQDRAIADGYLTVGLVIAAFAQLQLAASSGAYPGMVGPGDALRIAFDLVLLLGILAEARASMAAMRRENAALERLRAAEADRAVLEERARVSRELHDGLAQELWLAKLKSARLARQPELGEEARTLCADLGTAIDTALAEARQTVLALRDEDRRDTGFADLLVRCVEDAGGRFGLPTEVECGDRLPDLPPRAQAELLRIVQEALNNVGRHADATAVRVSVTASGSRLMLSVHDNGRGFEPATIRRGFGLTSMRERAESIGGFLVVASRPTDGTTVRVEMQVAVAMAAMSAGT